MAVRAFDSVNAGDALPEKHIPITRATLVQYAGASLDRNPIHWDDRFATKVGLPDVIAHGMFTMGAAGTVVAEWAGDAGRIVSYGTRFTKPVVVSYADGAELVVSGTVKSVDAESRQATVELTATAADTKVLGRCVAVVRLD